MKQPSRLTRHQKEILKKMGMDWNEYMCVCQDPKDENHFTIISKEKKEGGDYEVITVRKTNKGYERTTGKDNDNS